MNPPPYTHTYRALQYLTPLLEHPDLNEPGLWAQLLRCHRALGEQAAAAAGGSGGAGGAGGGGGGGVEEGLALYRAQLDGMDPEDSR